MNRQIYTLSLYLLSPIILLYFLYRGIKDARYLMHFSERFGQVSKQKDDLKENSPSDTCVLIHCASVGETKAAIPLIKELIKDSRINQLLITNTSPTGRKEAAQLIQALKKECENSVHLFNSYLPIDWPVACRAFLNKLNPTAVVLMETELWPNLINQCKRKNIPVILANARMSKKSSQKYAKHPKLTQGIFSGISCIASQYQSDKNQFMSLGISESKIYTIGSIKFDIKINSLLAKQQAQLKKQWCNNRPCWIACSIHPGEFSLLLNAHKKLLEKFSDLLLIAVPRHPEQFTAFKIKTQESQLNYVCRSNQQEPNSDTQVMVADTMGELMLLCGAADIAYVGGSLIDRGGHNPLEPAACGLSVIMGESDFNFADVSKIMQEYNVLNIIKDEEQLISRLEQRFTLGETDNHQRNIQSMFDKNGQAINKTSKLIEQFLE